MMAAKCGICREIEPCYSLPCHEAHFVCRGCLTRTTQTLGRSLKCPDCGELFGMIDIDLLSSQGETIPDKRKCVTCLEGERDEAGLATQYCVDCHSGICEEHFQVHQGFFCGKRSHRTIPFDDYRRSSDKMSTWNCELHAGTEVTVVCSGCKVLGCQKCQALVLVCPQGEKHDYIALETKTVTTTQNLTSRSKGIKTTFMNCQDERLKVLTDMESYRINIVSRKDNLKQQYEQQVKQLKEEYQTKDEALDKALQAKGMEVEEKRNLLVEQEAALQELQDRMAAIISSYHPARLVTGEEEILAHINPAPVEDHNIAFLPPPLLSADVSSENLLGMNLIGPIEYIETAEKPVSEKYCYTVCHQPAGEPIIQAGVNYNSQEGLDTGEAIVRCVRLEENGNVMVLLRDKCEYIVTYQPSTNQGSRRKQYKELNRFTVSSSFYRFYSSLDSRFVKEDDWIYQTYALIINKICIFNSQGEQKAELTHEDIKNPLGICANNTSVFVGCTDSIWTFKRNDPQGTLRKLADCGGCGNIPGLCYYQHHLYVKPKEGSLMMIYSVSGEKVAELELPNSPFITNDMQIHSDGRLALAGFKEGAVCYRISNM